MSHVYFQMASSIVVPKYSCWLCPDRPSFEKNRQLKTHMMASPHSCLRVICPWCTDEEKSFRGVADLKPHCSKHHAKKLEELSTNFLSEANGFWLCTNPRDYIKLITPTSWDSKPAVRARIVMLNWLHNVKKTRLTKSQLESGWSQVPQTRSRRSPSTESTFRPDYEEEEEVPAKRQRDRSPSYSPNKPLVVPVMTFCQLWMENGAFVVDLLSEDKRVFWRAYLSRDVMSNQPAMASLTRRRTNPSPCDPPLMLTDLEGGQETTRIQIGRRIGVPDLYITRVQRGYYPTFQAVRSSPPVTSSEAELVQTEVTSCTPTRAPSPAPQTPAPMTPTTSSQSVTPVLMETCSPSVPMPLTPLHFSHCVTPSASTSTATAPSDIAQPHIPSVANTNDDQKRAEGILRVGCMPLIPPARRSWGQKQITLNYNDTVMTWPPTAWNELTGDQRLLAVEYAAMKFDLGTESGVKMAYNRGDLIERYNMLVLPGTTMPTIKDAPRKCRYYNYETLRIIAAGKDKVPQSSGVLAMWESGMACRNRELDGLVSAIDRAGIKLRLDIPL